MILIKKINIKNYKCFNNVYFNLKDINVLIGENNAGKSTVIEVLKLISLAIEILKKGRFVECPKFLSESIREKCVKLNPENLLIDLENTSFKYNNEDSIINVEFENNIKLKLCVHKTEIFSMIFHNKQNIKSKAEVISLNLPDLFVMPHFNLLRDLEKLIDEKRTQRDRFNYRSSLHFRNELLLYKDKIEDLNSKLSTTWKNISVSLEYKYGDDYILLLVRNNDFNGEVKIFGSGLQMWIQILWFLCKIDSRNSIVVLDEPDVYIHADLQRKLYDLVANSYEQIVIATYSIEIINESELEKILLVDKNKSQFSFCKNQNYLSMALKSIGTSQNTMLTKLQRHNKIIFVEGLDLEILDYMFKVCNNQSVSIKDYAYSILNGKTHYKEMIESSKLLKEQFGNSLKIYCILDKDYNEKYNTEIINEANNIGIELLILHRIEIENYMIIPRIISDIISKDEQYVKDKIVELASELRSDTFDRILAEKFNEERKLNSGYDLSKISKETREYINNNWQNFDSIINIVPGKELKGKIYQWIKDDYCKSVNDKKILSKIEKNDIPDELKQFLEMIFNDD